MLRFYLFFLLAFLILFIILSFDGYYFYDDTTYARYAFLLSQGKLTLNEEIFSHRLGIILPIALGYTIIGVNDFTTVWFPAVCTMTSLVVIYFLLKKENSQVIIWAIILFSLDFYTVFFSNKLYPDVGLTCMTLLAAISLYKRGNLWIQPVVFCLANLWGFLCKETIVYLLPFYGMVWVYDLTQKQYLLFWKRAFMIGPLVLACYFGFYYIYTGNPLYRFQIIQDGHYVASYNYFHKPASALIPRLTYEPILMLIHSGMIICILGTLLTVFRPTFWRWNVWSPSLFWSRLAFSGLAMFWGFTTSFQYYNPNALFPRMILFLIPFFAIASAYELQNLNARKSFILATLLLLITGISWYTGVPNQAVQYGLLAIGLGVTGVAFLVFANSFFIQKAIYIHLVVILLLLHPVYSMLKASESGYNAEKHIVQHYLLNLQKPTIIFTDNKLLNGADFYYGFEKPTQITFLPYEELLKWNNKSVSSAQCLVLINSYSVEYFRLIGSAPPIYIDKPPSTWQLITEEKGVRLYQIPI